MESVLLATLMIIVIAMVITILLQQSEGGALGIGGNGPGGMMSARGAADFLSKTTKWLAFAFFINVLALGWLSANRDNALSDVLDGAAQQINEEPKPEEVPEG